VLKFPNRVTWTNLTLKKGIGVGTALWDWHYGFVLGRGRRRDGTIMLLDEQRQPQQVWFFRRGLPVKYTGPSLNATQNNVAIETLEVAHEGIHQVPGIGTSGVVGAAIAGAVG
jgi:phage tail-like protein